MRPTSRLLAVILLCGALLAAALPAFAQEALTPPQAAESLRQRLFAAQVALLGDDPLAAAEAVSEADTLYREGLQAAIATAVPDLDARITASLESAPSLVERRDPAGFAALRGQTWSALLEASTRIVQAALSDGDAETAARWLPLREFRLTTRFSRPAADATLAVNAFGRAAVDAETAWEAVRADLLDTYQARLAAALAAADQAHANGFALRRAEEAGLAAGYFDILADSYRDQRGAEALDAALAAFAALADAAASDDAPGYVAARGAVDGALAGFRAAPLSDEELARRAGQFDRFLALVPIEYARGVRGGVVISDIEVQEALTFHAGAAAAFADLEPALAARDRQAAEQVRDLLARALDQLRQVAEPADLDASVSEARRVFGQAIPDAWQSDGAGSDVDVVLTVLDGVAEAAAQGDYRAAESARLEAYALLELGVEQRLAGFAPEMAARVESLFWQGTREQPGLAALLAAQASPAEVRAGLSQLQAALGEARLVLEAGRSAPAAVVSNAAVIVFREGLEAVLILASLLASLRAAEQRHFRRPLVLGAFLALLASVVTWWIAARLLDVLLPLGETLEAIVSLIAIGVLLLITNWFFHKTYWTGWMAGFHARKRRLIGGVLTLTLGQAVGLVVLGFTSIYREGFETVLFLQSLVLEAGTSTVLQGVALGLLATAGVGVATFALQMRLPYKRMFVITGVMIGVVLLTMVGHTVHVMQTLGWLPVTPIGGVYLPFWMGQWFGLHATWEGLALQVAAAGFVIGSYFLAERQQRLRRATPHQEPQQAAG